MNKISQKDIHVHEIKKVFVGYSLIEEITFSQTDHQGNISDRVSREIFSKGDAVAIVPFEPSTNLIWLVKQMRPAALLSECEPYQWEIPAGLISKDETAEEAARRELEEETCLKNTQLRYICNFFPSPGNSKDRVFLFVAIVENGAIRDGRGGVNEESEFIDFRAFNYEEVLELVQKNIVQNSTTMLGIMLLDKYRSELLSL